MARKLDEIDRRDENAAWVWWRATDHSCLSELRKNKLCLASIFVEGAKHFLSI